MLQSMGLLRVGHDLVTELTENEYDSSFAIFQGQIQLLGIDFFKQKLDIFTEDSESEL